MVDRSHLKCPDVDNCASSDAYSHNIDKGVGYCHSCTLKTWVNKGKLYAKSDFWSESKVLENEVADFICSISSSKNINKEFNPDEDDPWAYVEDDEEEGDTLEASSVNTEGEYVTRRSVSAKTMEFFNVKNYGGVEEHYIYPSGGIKVRKFPKEFFAKNLKSDELFGMNLFPANCAKVLTVCEGELDCLSAYQMLSANNSYLNPVVSVPSATPPPKFWEKNNKYFESFEKIVLSLDSDEVGQKLAKKFSEIYPEKVYIMNHGNFKDANDFLVNGKGKEYKNLWWGAKKYKPDFIISDTEDFLKVFHESPKLEFFKTGIPELDFKLGGGISKGYITLVQAKTGVGKTQLVRMLEYACWKGSGFKFATEHLEETHKESLLGLVCYDLNDNLFDKSKVEEKGKVLEVEQSISNLTKDGRIVFYNIDPSDTNDDIIKKFKYLVSAMEVDFIFLEPVQDAVAGSSASEKEGRISDLVTRMGNLCGETGVGFIVIAHENSDGGAMYSSMITKKAGFKITLSADRESEDLTLRNRTFIKVVDKNRSGRGFGDAGMVDFNYDTYTLTPVVKEEPVIEHKDDVPF